MSNCEYLQSVAPTWTERYWLIAILLVLASACTACLVMALINIYKYLYQDKRWKIFLLATFYTCVFCILSARILYSLATIRLYSAEPYCTAYFSQQYDNIATYFYAIFGIF